ncbi:MAG: hypothetical protein EKK46_06025 [Rhodocyclaceae bacterium]|nr:MAG: hypothetical protein EKK46_06025 [Rhodocyclaceae bacterium]
MTTYDFDLALARHAIWMTRLKLYVLGIGEQGLTAELAADSTACELGQWLLDGGRQYAASPGFSALLAAHDHFHAVAGEVVRLHRAGDATEAVAVLEQVLPEATDRVTQALVELRKLQQ